MLSVGTEEPTSDESSTRDALLLVVVVFVAYCCVQVRDGVIIRPHPVIWRGVHGVGIVYFLCVIYCLAVTPEQARAFLRFMLPDEPFITKDDVEISYANDCKLFATGGVSQSMSNVWLKCDIFILAHLFGWIGKSILLRDWKLLIILSVVFEVLEVSFQHILPNFRECWWDHLFLDMLGCNLAGMVIGMQCVRFFEGRSYDWAGLDEISTRSGKIRRIAMQFTPRSFQSYKWEAVKSKRSFALVFFLVLFWEIMELCTFGLKAVLHVPPQNNVNLYRLLTWGMMGLPAHAELYQWITDASRRRIGQNLWLVLGTLSCECLLIVKCGEDTFVDVHWWPPTFIVMNWSLFLALLCVWFFHLDYDRQAPSADALRSSRTKWKDFIRYVVPLPLLAILVADFLETAGVETDPFEA